MLSMEHVSLVGSVLPVRRQIIWDFWRRDRMEDLAHLLTDVMRPGSAKRFAPSVSSSPLGDIQRNCGAPIYTVDGQVVGPLAIHCEPGN